MAEGREVLARAIDGKRKEIERRWLEAVQSDIVRNPGVELTQLRDGMPDYLVALAALLRHPGEAADLGERSSAAWATVAREHGITRVRLGFNIAQLIHEFIVLRQIIRDVAREEGLDRAWADAVLADMLDAAIVVSVQAYVDARDFEARRAQAENIGFLTHEL